MAGGSFRSAVFDPILLISQIVAVQCSYYLCLSAIVLAFELLTGAPVTLRHLLNAAEMDASTVFGWSLALAFLLASTVTCYLILIIVERSRLCLDFACTLHGFHWIFVSLYMGRVPRSLFWWIVMLASTVVVWLGSEQLCIRKELEPIELGGGGNSGNSGGTAAAISGSLGALAGAKGSGRRRRGDGMGADDVELESLDPSNNV
eukprot:jgi/Hompol1/4430/HPOL_007104-RA